MGNNPCIPYDVCVKAFAGNEADIVHWEQVHSIYLMYLWFCIHLILCRVWCVGFFISYSDFILFSGICYFILCHILCIWICLSVCLSVVVVFRWRFIFSQNYAEALVFSICNWQYYFKLNIFIYSTTVIYYWFLLFNSSFDLSYFHSIL